MTTFIAEHPNAPMPRLSELPAPPEGRIGWPWTEANGPLPAAMPNGKPWPRITIVTPSYNQAQYIEETIRSVLLQGYPNLEYIIMDGGSSDGSAEIIQRYAAWCHYVSIGPDDGQSAAIADGFDRASGDILAWINSDDRYLPGAFSRVARFFAAHPRVVFGNGDVNIIDSDGAKLRHVLAVHPLPRVTATLGNHSWPQQGTFWRRSVYRKVGGVDRTLQFSMDRDLFLRLTSAGTSRRIPGLQIAEFREHGEAKSTRMLETWAREDKLLRQRYASRFGQQRWYRQFLQWRWKTTQLECGVRRRASRYGFEI